MTGRERTGLPVQPSAAARASSNAPSRRMSDGGMPARSSEKNLHVGMLSQSPIGFDPATDLHRKLPGNFVRFCLVISFASTAFGRGGNGLRRIREHGGATVDRPASPWNSGPDAGRWPVWRRKARPGRPLRRRVWTRPPAAEPRAPEFPPARSISNRVQEWRWPHSNWKRRNR